MVLENSLGQKVKETGIGEQKGQEENDLTEEAS